jgi:hypothetical protein
MSNTVKELLGGISPKEIGKHLLNYTSLYILPAKSWQKAFNGTIAGYEFIILHLIYYSLFLLLFLDEWSSVVRLTLYEIVLTIIPFCITIIPYKLSSAIYKLRLSARSLFRLQLIIKFQFMPIMILLYILAFRLKSDDLFIILDNLYALIFIAFIAIGPFLIKTKWWYRFIWLLMNYIFLLLYFFTFSLLIEKTDLFDNFNISDQIPTPSAEYVDFKISSSDSYLYIQDSLFMAIGIEESPSIIAYKEAIPVDIELFGQYLRSSQNDLLRNMIWNGNKSKNTDLNSEVITDSLLQKINQDTLTKERLTLAQKRINKMIFEDITLTDFLKKKNSLQTKPAILHHPKFLS